MSISEGLMSEWRKFADRCTPNTETGSLNYREFAVLVRNAALEEAAVECGKPHPYFSDSRTMMEITDAIRNLKMPTP